MRNEVAYYEDLTVEWVGGHAPTVYLFDAEGKEVEQFLLFDMDLLEVLDLLSHKGFVPTKKKVTFPEAPTKVAQFGGHLYELYDAKHTFPDVLGFAEAQSREGQNGYLVTLTHPKEDEFIRQFLADNNVETAWLGASDLESESEWTWTSGPEKGTKFFSGNGRVGVAIKDGFVNWHEGEPNNVGDEDCAVVMSSGWNDAACNTERYPFLVEYGTSVLDIPVTLELTPKIEQDTSTPSEEKSDL